MVCKIIFCSEFPDIPDKAGRKTRRRRRRRRTEATAKCYAFHANAISSLLLKTSKTTLHFFFMADCLLLHNLDALNKMAYKETARTQILVHLNSCMNVKKYII